MRFKEFKITPESTLDEVKMSPGRLEKFATSPAAEGIQAGFEAELIFAGATDGYRGGGEMEPDYDADEDARSIRQVLRFFSYDDYGYGLSRRQQDRLESQLLEEYSEWFEDHVRRQFESVEEDFVAEYMKNNVWDQDTYVEQILSDDYSPEEIERIIRDWTNSESDYPIYTKALKQAKAMFKRDIDDEIKHEGKYWQRAFNEFREDYEDQDLEQEFLDERYGNMSSIAESFNLEWPYMMEVDGDSDEGFSEDAARDLAKDFSRKFDALTKVGSGYHSATRTAEHWIFEADSSIHPDDSLDLPIEIVSPPMPLSETLAWLESFFTWASDNDAYTNNTTGFHMSVSLPDHGNKRIDTIKLAIFLGDEYVLDSFGRASNTYTQSFLQEAQRIFKRSTPSAQDLQNVVAEYQKNLASAAGKLAFGNPISSAGFGKYFSINPKSKYIEFRSAGGEDYQKNIPLLQDTLRRYAYALTIASDPQAERKEYLTKLYKALSGGIKAGVSAQILELFAKYSAKLITQDQLRDQWLKIATAAQRPAEPHPEGYFGDWIITDRDGKVVQTYPQIRGNQAVKQFAAEFGNGSLYDARQAGYDIDLKDGSAKKPGSARAELAKRIQSKPAKDTGPKRWIVFPVFNQNLKVVVDAFDETEAKNAAKAIKSEWFGSLNLSSIMAEPYNQ